MDEYLDDVPGELRWVLRDVQDAAAVNTPVRVAYAVVTAAREGASVDQVRAALSCGRVAGPDGLPLPLALGDSLEAVFRTWGDDPVALKRGNVWLLNTARMSVLRDTYDRTYARLRAGGLTLEGIPEGWRNQPGVVVDAIEDVAVFRYVRENFDLSGAVVYTPAGVPVAAEEDQLRGARVDLLSALRDQGLAVADVAAYVPELVETPDGDQVTAEVAAAVWQGDSAQLLRALTVADTEQMTTQQLARAIGWGLDDFGSTRGLDRVEDRSHDPMFRAFLRATEATWSGAGSRRQTLDALRAAVADKALADRIAYAETAVSGEELEVAGVPAAWRANDAVMEAARSVAVAQWVADQGATGAVVTERDVSGNLIELNAEGAQLDAAWQWLERVVKDAGYDVIAGQPAPRLTAEAGGQLPPDAFVIVSRESSPTRAYAQLFQDDAAVDGIEANVRFTSELVQDFEDDPAMSFDQASQLVEQRWAGIAPGTCGVVGFTDGDRQGVILYGSPSGSLVGQGPVTSVRVGYAREDRFAVHVPPREAPTVSDDAFMVETEDYDSPLAAYNALPANPPASFEAEDTSANIGLTDRFAVPIHHLLSGAEAERVALDGLPQMQPGECEAVTYSYKPGGQPKVTGHLLYGRPNSTLAMNPMGTKATLNFDAMGGPSMELD